MDGTIPSTSTRLRVLGLWMLVLGLVLGLGAFSILQLSQDKIESARLNLGPDEYVGTVTRFWICTGVGLAVAAVGAILLFLNPRQAAIALVVDRAPATSSIEDRLAAVRLLLDQGNVSDDEYQQQRKRILDQT